MTLQLTRLKVITTVCALFVLTTAKAQKKHLFSFVLPKYKVEHSLYNKIYFIDNRADTSELGRILTGSSSKQTIVVPKEPLRKQVSSVLLALTGTDPGKGELC